MTSPTTVCTDSAEHEDLLCEQLSLLTEAITDQRWTGDIHLKAMVRRLLWCRSRDTRHQIVPSEFFILSKAVIHYPSLVYPHVAQIFESLKACLLRYDHGYWTLLSILELACALGSSFTKESAPGHEELLSLSINAINRVLKQNTQLDYDDAER
jgi:hypothetical protein